MERQPESSGALEKDLKIPRKAQMKYTYSNHSLRKHPLMCTDDYYNIASNRRKLERSQASGLIPNTSKQRLSYQRVLVARIHVSVNTA